MIITAVSSSLSPSSSTTLASPGDHWLLSFLFRWKMVEREVTRSLKMESLTNMKMRLDKPAITQIIIIIITKIILIIILNLWPIRRWGHSARLLYHNCLHHCITILIINDRNRKSLLFSGKSKLQSWVLTTSRSTTWCGGWSWTSTEQRMRCSSWRRSSGGYLFIFVHHFFYICLSFHICLPFSYICEWGVWWKIWTIYILWCSSVCLSRKIITSSWEPPVTTQAGFSWF